MLGDISGMGQGGKMKCDELTEYRGPTYGEPYYDIDEVDAAIAELKQKLQYQCVSCSVKMQEDDVISGLKAEIALLQAMFEECNKQIVELKEERRWRRVSEEKPTEEMEGMDFIVSNGFFHREISEWRGYWNNDPFCDDKNCDVVKFWMPLPPAPREDSK
jgi:hypothetical protein